MQVSASDWERYIGRLQAVNRAAAEVMQGWMNENPGGDVEDMIAVAYAASTYYGDAAATLACEMYDALAEAQGAELPPAEPAETATYSETAKAVRGTIKNQRNSVPDTVGRLVKQAGADTMLQNARRDGAEWAWVPFGGETCAFCITLASRGWQRQGKKAAEGDHAEHIHPHCQCEYVVRFDGSSTVEGYDPDRYLELYENAEGLTPNEKMRSLRRGLYAENKDRINGQKRVAYRERKRATVLTLSSKNGNMALYRKSTQDEREGFRFISDERFDQLTIPAKKTGAVIIRNDPEWNRYLKENGATAATIGDTMIFGEKVCISEVLEELRHVEQNHIGLNDDKSAALREILNEIEAREYIFSIAPKYQIPRNEMDLMHRQYVALQQQLHELQEV